ncbi:hypothetical protein Tco_0118169, partial [Tanacetum coccineum]
NDFLRFVGVFLAEFAAGGAVNLALKMKGDMIIKNLDMKLMIDAMMREFLEEVLETSPCFRERFSLMLLEHQDVISEFCSPSRWKEFSMETSSKILPCGDGSCWKTFKPTASLIAKGKLK